MRKYAHAQTYVRAYMYIIFLLIDPLNSRRCSFRECINIPFYIAGNECFSQKLAINAGEAPDVSIKMVAFPRRESCEPTPGEKPCGAVPLAAGNS